MRDYTMKNEDNSMFIVDTGLSDQEKDIYVKFANGDICFYDNCNANNMIIDKILEEQVSNGVNRLNYFKNHRIFTIGADVVLMASTGAAIVSVCTMASDTNKILLAGLTGASIILQGVLLTKTFSLSRTILELEKFKLRDTNREALTEAPKYAPNSYAGLSNKTIEFLESSDDPFHARYEKNWTRSDIETINRNVEREKVLQLKPCRK